MRFLVFCRADLASNERMYIWHRHLTYTHEIKKSKEQASFNTVALYILQHLCTNKCVCVLRYMYISIYVYMYRKSPHSFQWYTSIVYIYIYIYRLFGNIGFLWASEPKVESFTTSRSGEKIIICMRFQKDFVNIPTDHVLTYTSYYIVHNNL